jgi:hypothetical protein
MSAGEEERVKVEMLQDRRDAKLTDKAVVYVGAKWRLVGKAVGWVRARVVGGFSASV